jgi:hypothetical protein
MKTVGYAPRSREVLLAPSDFEQPAWADVRYRLVVDMISINAAV